MTVTQSKEKEQRDLGRASLYTGGPHALARGQGYFSQSQHTTQVTPNLSGDILPFRQDRT